MSDTNFIREVEEEVRRERLKKIWTQFGPYILFGAFSVVAIVAGVKFWEYWQKSQSESAGARLVNAQMLATDGKNTEARAVFESLSASGPGGYPVLARLRLAANAAKEGKTDEALKIYDALALSSGADSLLRGFSKISAALLRIDEADFAEIKDRVGAMAVENNHWRHSARELLGLSAFRAREFDTAKTYYNELLADQNAPQNLRQRAEVMLGLMFGQQGSGADDAKAAPAADGEAAKPVDQK